jgi:hypothetical protein
MQLYLLRHSLMDRERLARAEQVATKGQLEQMAACGPAVRARELRAVAGCLRAGGARRVCCAAQSCWSCAAAHGAAPRPPPSHARRNAAPT